MYKKLLAVYIHNNYAIQFLQNIFYENRQLYVEDS